jgi:hypothetical protein
MKFINKKFHVNYWWNLLIIDEIYLMINLVHKIEFSLKYDDHDDHQWITFDILWINDYLWDSAYEIFSEFNCSDNVLGIATYFSRIYVLSK